MREQRLEEDEARERRQLAVFKTQCGQVMGLAVDFGFAIEPQADARRLLAVNRGRWSIENTCHCLLDWNYDEDRGRIRTGHGPENVTRLRRFAIGVI